MNNKLLKYIPILFVIIILTIAGWYVGTQALNKRIGNTNTAIRFMPTTNNVAIYEVKEGAKLTIYKVNLDGSDSSVFYALNVNKPASNLSDPFPQTTIMNNKIFRSATQNDQSVKIITLDGKEKSDLITQSENPFVEQGSWVVSFDETLKMQFQPISPQREISVLNNKNNKLSTIDAESVPRTVSEIRPVGFSSDNKLAYFVGTTEEDTQSIISEGFYAYNRSTNTVKEIRYSDFKENPKSSSFLFFDSTSNLAYFKENDRILQFNPMTEKMTEMTELRILSNNDIHLSVDGKNIFIDSQVQPSNDTNTAMVMIGTEAKMQTNLPIYGEFKQTSSDGRFLVYVRYSRAPHGNPINITSPTNVTVQNQEFLNRTEYRSFDLQTKKDILLVADEQITNTLQPRIKQVTFLGLIATK